jgi:hypothetical protein
MKKALSILGLGLLGAVMLGCEAGARIDPNIGDEDRAVERRTTIERDGTRTTTRTEVQVDR